MQLDGKNENEWLDNRKARALFLDLAQRGGC
jgi:hypothetical protein